MLVLCYGVKAFAEELEKAEEKVTLKHRCESKTPIGRL